MHLTQYRCWLVISLITSVVVTATVTAGDATKPTADDPLAIAGQIDQRVGQRWDELEIEPAPLCSDRVFVRRAYLDLVGRIPRVEEMDSFLADRRDDRRRQLVQQLTHSEDYVQHFADTFDALLMGRGSADDYHQRRRHGWRKFLCRVFRENRPWNNVIQEVLVARPQQQVDQGSHWFLYERQDQHQQIAEAIAPAVFGIRIECAQCHDHPLAAEIQQAHYWGLVAFFNRGKNVDTKNGPRVSESAVGGFSEFADLTGDSHPNLLTFFQASPVEESRPEKDAKPEDRDDLYRAAEVEGDPRVPIFSRRREFAEQVAANHPLVARTMVNRIWAMLMGRGIVHPFDEMDSVHTASHPQLLDWLADVYQRSGYDTRRLVQGIVMSQPYQLAAARPEGVDDPAAFAWYLERPLTAEQATRSIQLAVCGEFHNDDRLVERFRESIQEVMPEQNMTTVKEALFLSNNNAINGFLRDSMSAGQLVPKLQALESHEARSELLFQTVFGRRPRLDEIARIQQYLGDEQPAATRLQQVVWALLTSAEFRFNH